MKEVVCLIVSFTTGLVLCSEMSYLIPLVWGTVLIGTLLCKSPAKNAILLGILLYPMLPFHFGFDIGSGLPVLKLHRVLLLFLYIIWILDRGVNNIKESLSNYPLRRVFVVVGVVLICICILNGGGSRAYNYTFSFLIESCFLSFVVFDYFRDETDQKKLLFIICCSGAIIAISAIFERMVAFNWYSIIPSYREQLDFALESQIRLNDIRVKAAFPHAISFGATVAIIGSISLISLLYETKKSLKFFYLLSTALMLLSCIYTLSRGPLLMFGFITILVLARKAKRWLLIFFLLGFILFTQPFYEFEFVDSVHESIGNFLGANDAEISDSSSARLWQLGTGLSYLAAKPLFGYGFQPINKYLDITVDNFYLRYALNFGVIGLASLLCILGLVLKKTGFMVFYAVTRFQQHYAIACLASLISILILWFTVSLEDYMFYFWVMTGILMRMYLDVKLQRGGAEVVGHNFSGIIGIAEKSDMDRLET